MRIQNSVQNSFIMDTKKFFMDTELFGLRIQKLGYRTLLFTDTEEPLSFTDTKLLLFTDTETLIYGRIQKMDFFPNIGYSVKINSKIL